MSSDETPETPEENVEADAPEAPEPEAAAEAPEPEATEEAPDPTAAVEEPESDESESDEVDEPEAQEPQADDAEDQDEDEDGDEDEADVEPEAEARPSRRVRRRRRGAAAAEEAPVETPKPAARKPRRDPNLPAPVVRAQAKYVRSSARKARLVCDNIRGKSVEEARAILALTPRAIAQDWSKLLESAVANAEHNHELVGEDLYVKAVTADEGPTIKRFRPRAMGRATKIRKRTSHLTILLTPKE
jgi:ribosomal protein L22